MMTTIEAKDTIANTWYQIHTNGGTTTFARWYVGMTEQGEPVFGFEKLQADHSFEGGHAEIFGREEFSSMEAVVSRVQEAIELAR